MQMYRVEFTSVRGRLVERGEFLCCAQNADAARDLVSTVAHVQPSDTVFDVVRVKPSIYELRRSEFVKNDLPAFITGGKEEDGAVFEMTATAKVFAWSNENALRRLAGALIDEASANKGARSRHVNELSVDIQKADERPRPSRVEEQSIYREKRFFPGGAARPR